MLHCGLFSAPSVFSYLLLSSFNERYFISRLIFIGIYYWLGGEPHLPRTHRISIPVRLCLRLDLIRSKENCRIRKWRSPIFISRHFCLGPKSQSQMGEYFCKTNKSQVICFSPPSHLEKIHFRGKTGLPSPRTPAKMVYFFSFSFFPAY